ncbi:MAG: FAD-dependent tricarballylate dehydrogenase TcuA [Alphaproteobacteria bacterium]
MNDWDIMDWDVIVVGSGNAGLCAGISACENGARVLMIEKAAENLAGGNTKYTAGAMRFVYDKNQDLLPLLKNRNDPRIAKSDFGQYSAEKFRTDLEGFNEGAPLTGEQEILVSKSYETMLWLAKHGVTYDPIYGRQSFEKDGKFVFWGGLTLAAENEGVGLFEMELGAYKRLGGHIRYETSLQNLHIEAGRIAGVVLENGDIIPSKTVILACGGFEANSKMRGALMGSKWKHAKPRGTPHNTGDGLRAAWALGAAKNGAFKGAHATPMDLYMKDFGNLNIPHGERKNYRKISYFLGIMINADGQRFVDEGKDFRNYTYAQFGKAVLEQPKQFAWQIFDGKVIDLLYPEYRFFDASFVKADTIEELIKKCEGVDAQAALRTIADYNNAVDDRICFDPTIKDGKGTQGLALAKSNWAQKIDKGPYYAYPVTGGITFTYGGLKVSGKAEVQQQDDQIIKGLFACGETVGGVFLGGYPGGSGLTSGAVFGRIAGSAAANFAKSF